MLRRMPPSNRKKPTRKRQTGPYVGLHVKVFFDQTPKNHFELMRGLAEYLLCLTDDAKLRRLYTERFGLGKEEPIPNIPTDDLLAEVVEEPLAEVRQAREEEAWPDFRLIRYAGTGQQHRAALEVNWWPEVDDFRGSLEVFICLNDLPTSRIRQFNDAVHAIFDRCIDAGNTRYGFAQFISMDIRTWGTSTLHDHEPPAPAALIDSRMTHFAEADLENFVPAVRWFTLLNKRHVAKLGGAKAFLAEMDALASNKASPHRLLHRQYSGGELLLQIPFLARLDTVTDLKSTGYHPSIAVTEWSVLLTCRFAAAGLLACQSDKTLAAATEWVRRMCSGKPEADYFAKAQATESADTLDRQNAFMDRLWNSPPRCIAKGAIPLMGAHRSTIARSRGGHGAAMTGFKVAKGDKPVGIWGTFNRNGEMRPPIAIGGPSEKAALGFFDQRQHGHDGEQAIGGTGPEWGSTMAQPTRALDAYHCSRCGHDRFEVVAMFEYGDAEDYGEPPLSGHPEDYFSWFSLLATCAQCGKKTEMANTECA